MPKKPSQSKPTPKLQTEQNLRRQYGVTKIIGVDEVGRGALAGPICVAAVEINFEIPGVNDSKLLSELKRQYLANLISQNAQQIKFGWATNKEIDELGLAVAQRLAYERALEHINAELVLTDNVALDRPHISKIRGDQYFYSVAAASIVAKVLRDNLLRSYNQFFPNYFWHKNAGYGTKAHFDAIEQHGATRLHRLSFIKKGPRSNSVS